MPSARSKVDGVGDIEHYERWTIWSLPGTTGQRVVAVDGRVPDARERIEVVPASQLEGAVSELRQAHERLTRDGVPTHDDHGKPLGLTLRIAVALDTAGGR